MSGVKLTYTIDDQAAREFLSRLGDADTRPMFDEIGGYLDSEVARRFISGEDWEGNALIPSQRALNEGGKTLVEFVHLRDSYTHNVYIDGSGVEHGSGMVYAAIQHYGGKTGRNHSTELPPRPVMGINAHDESEINNIVDDFYQSVVNG